MADEEEQKVAAIAVVVSGKQRDCEEDLAKAEPALQAAQDALNTLNKVGSSVIPHSALRVRVITLYPYLIFFVKFLFFTLCLILIFFSA